MLDVGCWMFDVGMCSIEKIEILKGTRKIRKLSVSVSAMKWGRGPGRWCSGNRGRSFLQSMFDVGCRLLDVLYRKDRNFERHSKNPKAIRLPLRHEMGERAGVRWCLGNRGRSVQCFLQRMFDVLCRKALCPPILSSGTSADGSPVQGCTAAAALGRRFLQSTFGVQPSVFSIIPLGAFTHLGQWGLSA